MANPEAVQLALIKATQDPGVIANFGGTLKNSLKVVKMLPGENPFNNIDHAQLARVIMDQLESNQAFNSLVVDGWQFVINFATMYGNVGDPTDITGSKTIQAGKKILTDQRNLLTRTVDFVTGKKVNPDNDSFVPLTLMNTAGVNLLQGAAAATLEEGEKHVEILKKRVEQFSQITTQIPEALLKRIDTLDKNLTGLQQKLATIEKNDLPNDLNEAVQILNTNPLTDSQTRTRASQATRKVTRTNRDIAQTTVNLRRDHGRLVQTHVATLEEALLHKEAGEYLGDAFDSVNYDILMFLAISGNIQDALQPLMNTAREITRSRNHNIAALSIMARGLIQSQLERTNNRTENKLSLIRGRT